MKISSVTIITSLAGAVGVAIADLIFPASTLWMVIGAAVGAMLGALAFKGAHL